MEEGGLASVIEFHAERGLELSEVPQLLERAPGHRRPDVLHVEGKVGELDDGAVGQDKAVALQGIGGEPMGPAEARVHVPGYPCSSTHHERLEFDGVDDHIVYLIAHNAPASSDLQDEGVLHGLADGKDTAQEWTQRFRLSSPGWSGAGSGLRAKTWRARMPLGSLEISQTPSNSAIPSVMSANRSLVASRFWTRVATRPPTSATSGRAAGVHLLQSGAALPFNRGWSQAASRKTERHLAIVDAVPVPPPKACEEALVLLSPPFEPGASPRREVNIAARSVPACPLVTAGPPGPTSGLPVDEMPSDPRSG